MTKRLLINLFIIMLFVLTVGAICLRLFFADKKVFSVFGYSAFVLSSSSMSPAYDKDCLVIVKNRPLSKIKTGDVVAFWSDAMGKRVAVHRVIRVENNGVYTKGDNNSFDDNQLIDSRSYIGTVVLGNHFLGRYISAISYPVGFILFFLLPVCIIYMIIGCAKRLCKKQSLASNIP